MQNALLGLGRDGQNQGENLEQQNKSTTIHPSQNDDNMDEDPANFMASLKTIIEQNAVLMQGVLQQQKQQSATVQYGVLPDLSHNIRDFDGLESSADALAWLRQLESTASLHKWTEAIAFETARSRLTGAARNWYYTNITEIVNWRTFRASFRDTFTTEKSLTDKWQEMQKRSQGQDEDVRTYYLDKLRLCKALKFSIDEIKTQIAVGLWSRNTAAAVMSQSYLDENDLLRTITEFEGLEQARKQRIDSQTSTSKTTTHDDRRKGKHGGKIQRSNSEASGYSKKSSENGAEEDHNNISKSKNVSNVECYKCHATGHIAKYCKSAVTCYNCGVTGHISKNCDKPKKMPTAETKLINTTCADASAKFLKNVKIGNVEKIHAVIDSGSSDCIIKASFVLEHGFKFIKTPNIIKGIGKPGCEVVSSGIIKEQIQVDECTEKDVIFRVAPDDILPYDVLVGQNFTELPNVVYYKIDDKLEFRTRDNHPFANYPEPVQTNRRVRPLVLESTNIPPASVNFVRVKVDEKEWNLPIQNFSEKFVSVNTNDELPSIRCNLIQGNIPELQVENEPIVESDFVVGPAVDAKQKESLLRLLNEYRVCCSRSDRELGCTNYVEMDIIETADATPVHSKPYKASAKQREQMKNIVGEWKAAGIVTETQSPYASPCLLVDKPDGSKRLVVDYRRLNKSTVRMNFPLPNIDDGLEELHGANIFAILDLAQGYLQIPLTERAKEKTAFITPDETGQFERAMFGLMNAPFYFSKLMKKVFGNFQNKLALFFFDDMLVYAKSWDELLEKLETVLQLLRDARLMLKLRKCRFGLEEVEYVGLIVGKNEIKPGERKIVAISEFPAPRNEHEVRRFIGMASYFRRFVRNFAHIAAPLSALLKKDSKFVWGEKQQSAFDEIKTILSSRPVLIPYNAKASKTELHCDASADGLGAMLFQASADDVLHPVYAISRRTTDVERMYHSTKLELLCIVWAMERLRPLLIRIPFVVYTDCEALIYVNSLKTKKPQIVRWLGEIADFEYEIRHRKGVNMQHVDALSHAPVEAAEIELADARVLNVNVHEGEILVYQHRDDDLKRKIEILQKSERDRTRREKGEVSGFVLRGGVLYKIDDGTEVERYVIPSAMRKAVVMKNHDFSGHFGIDRTVAKIKNFYYFPRMRSYVKRHIAACIECLFAKNKVGKQAGELHPIPPSNRPFEIVNLDHLGPFVSSTNKNKYILAAICNLTKFCQLYAVRNVKASTTATCIEKLIERFGAPVRFITDRGTAFTSSIFENLCKKHGVKHTLNSSRHAQANGQIERLNQTILPALQANLTDAEGLHWDKNLAKLENDLNASINKSTGKTPFEMLYGYIPRFEEGLSRVLTYAAETYRLPVDVRNEAIERIEKEQVNAKARYDKARCTNVKYNVGDIVFMKQNKIATGDSTKLQSRYKGPLMITEALPADTYRVQNLNAKNDIKATTSHVSQLKLWRNHPDDDDDCNDCSDTGSEDSVESKSLNNKCSSPKEDKLNNNHIVTPEKESENSNLLFTERPKRNRRMPNKFKDYVAQNHK
uniref:RNA-directed DNA polymerase n=1 Tax=Trichogramma kaykai TaxID=54128 RepID=A0ABD2VZA1_9HYME